MFSTSVRRIIVSSATSVTLRPARSRASVRVEPTDTGDPLGGSVGQMRRHATSRDVVCGAAELPTVRRPTPADHPVARCLTPMPEARALFPSQGRQDARQLVSAGKDLARLRTLRRTDDAAVLEQ